MKDFRSIEGQIAIAFWKRCIIVALIAALFIPNTSANTRWWQLFFTRWGHGSGSDVFTNPEDGLVRAIGGAQQYIHGAFYDLSAPRVVRALIDARQRGVAVSLVMEASNARRRRAIIERLEAEGITIVRDTGRGLMHNKFMIIDGDCLWTGSYNPTENDGAKNNNNAVCIRSGELCEIFEKEFQEMFTERIFGNRREPGPFALLRTKYHVRIDDTDINVYFSPEDNVERIIMKRLSKARVSIHFMAFSFTSDPIGEMMIRKHRQGIEVRGIFEKKGSRSQHSEYLKMKAEGLPVKLDRNRHAMHHKVIIIDGERVITGSYNFSRNASKHNDENIIIIDNRAIADAYLKEFNRLYR